MLVRAVRRSKAHATPHTLHSAYQTRCMQNSPHHTRPTPFTVGQAPVMHALYPATHTLYPTLSTPYPTPHTSCPMPHTPYPRAHAQYLVLQAPQLVPHAQYPVPYAHTPRPSHPLSPARRGFISARLHFSVYILNKKAGEPESEGLSTLRRIHIFSETV